MSKEHLHDKLLVSNLWGVETTDLKMREKQLADQNLQGKKKGNKGKRRMKQTVLLL